MRKPRGADCARDVGAFVSRFACKTRGDDVDLAHRAFEAVLLQVVRGRAEGVRLKHVRARAHVLFVYLAHKVGVGQVQLVV